jgi:hypothetical protein
MKKRRDPIFLVKEMDFQERIQEKGKVSMFGTTNGNILGKYMNLCKEVPKHKNFENGSTSGA